MHYRFTKIISEITEKGVIINSLRDAIMKHINYANFYSLYDLAATLEVACLKQKALQYMKSNRYENLYKTNEKLFTFKLPIFEKFLEDLHEIMKDDSEASKYVSQSELLKIITKYCEENFKDIFEKEEQLSKLTKKFVKMNEIDLTALQSDASTDSNASNIKLLHNLNLRLKTLEDQNMTLIEDNKELKKMVYALSDLIREKCVFKIPPEFFASLVNLNQDQINLNNKMSNLSTEMINIKSAILLSSKSQTDRSVIKKVT